jgi:hypothetical protein
MAARSGGTSSRAATCFNTHIELRLRQLAQLLGDPRVVFGQHNARSIHARTVDAWPRQAQFGELRRGPEEFQRGAPGGRVPEVGLSYWWRGGAVTVLAHVADQLGGGLESERLHDLAGE